MKTTFSLMNMRSDKKTSLSYAFSQYNARMAIIIMVPFLLIYLIADNFEFNALLAPFIVIVFFSLVLVFFPLGKSGKVTLSDKSIEIKHADDQPGNKISLRDITDLSIYTVQRTRFFPFLIVNFIAEHNGTTTDFGIVIKKQKLKKQYLGVLESWYRNSFPVKEFDELGNRVFKLNQGKNYADVQTIKAEYGIEW